MPVDVVAGASGLLLGMLIVLFSNRVTRYQPRGVSRFARRDVAHDAPGMLQIERLRWNGEHQPAYLVLHHGRTIGMVFASVDRDLLTFGSTPYVVAGVPGWSFPDAATAALALLTLHRHRTDDLRNDNIPLMYDLQQPFRDLGGSEYHPRKSWIFG